mgnify:CR=1 FL=1
MYIHSIKKEVSRPMDGRLSRRRLFALASVLLACRALSEESEAATAFAVDLYQRARAAFERAALAAAEPLFLAAAAAAPQFPEPHYALAQLTARLGRMEEAEAHMRAARLRIPEDQPLLTRQEKSAGREERIGVCVRLHKSDTTFSWRPFVLAPVFCGASF